MINRRVKIISTLAGYILQAGYSPRLVPDSHSFARRAAGDTMEEEMPDSLMVRRPCIMQGLFACISTMRRLLLTVNSVIIVSHASIFSLFPVILVFLVPMKIDNSFSFLWCQKHAALFTFVFATQLIMTIEQSACRCQLCHGCGC